VPYIPGTARRAQSIHSSFLALAALAMAQPTDLPLIQFVGAVVELVLYGSSVRRGPGVAWLTPRAGVYVVLFAGTVWVLRTWRQGARARVSPFIDICSWFVFCTLTAVRRSAARVAHCALIALC
jgi:hypothetical protein